MILKTLSLFLLFSLACISSATENPLSVAALELKLTDTGLSQYAQRFLRKYIFADKEQSDYRVKDVVIISSRYIRGRSIESEVTQFLSKLGLRLSMTRHEIEFYEQNGRLPAKLEGVTGVTDVESLGLSGRATNVLLNVGIKKLSDHLKTSLEELLRETNSGITTVREIEAAFEIAGFPFHQTRAEKKCQDSLSAPSGITAEEQ